MDCKTWRELASEYIEGTLDKPVAEAMTRHSVACASCRSDEEALRTVCRELNVLPTVDPPMFFRENLVSAIERGELGARLPVTGSRWRLLFPRLSRIAMGTLVAGGVCAAFLWGMMLPTSTRLFGGTRIAGSGLGTMIIGELPVNPGVDEDESTPRLHVGHVLTVLPQDGPVYDFSIWLENADKGVARFRLLGDKHVYRFSLGSGMAPQTLRIPLAGAQGQDTIALQVNWTAGGALHSKYLIVPVTHSDDRVPDRHQSFSLPESTLLDASRRVAGLYAIPVTLDDVAPIAADERIMIAADRQTASEALRTNLSGRNLQVSVSGAGVLVAPKSGEDTSN
jgi:hypothetical protein